MGKAITVRTVATWRHEFKRQEVPDSKVKGLYLVVQPRPSVVKSWAVRYRLHGKPAKYTIGKYPTIGLADARTKATDILQAVEDGHNPVRTSKAVSKGQHFSDGPCSTAIVEYKRNHLDSLRSGDKAFRFLEVGLVEMLGDPKLSSVTRKNLQHVLDEVKADGRGVTANRILTHCKTFFDWCVTREHCQTSPTVGIKKPFKEQPKDRWLSDDEIKLFWAACYQVHETYGALGRLLLLTGQRLGEVASMRFEEIDDAVWSIPKEKTKNGKAHTVPLCDEAIRLIKDDRFAVRTSGFVVSKTGVNPMSNFSRAKVSIAKAMQNASGVDIEPWTFHDLRRTYATGMQRLGVVIPVTESLLNHVSGSRAGIVGVYQRYEYKEEKIEAAKKWSDHIISVVNNEE